MFNIKVLKYLSAATCASLVICACNIFNPSGSGDGGDSSESQLAEGQRLIREQDYGAAMSAFQKAIAKDSTNTMAYYGYAKAAMQKYKISAAQMLTEVTDAQSQKRVPFLNQSAAKKTNYLQALSKVKWALSKLTERDTLTRNWNYYKQPDRIPSSVSLVVAEERIKSILIYLDMATTGEHPKYYTENKFPLSDRVMPFENITPDFGMAEMIYSVLKLQDLNNNDSIDKGDDLITKLNFNLEDGFKLENLADIQKDLENDTVAQQNFNNLIANVGSGLSSASTVIGLLGSLSGDSKKDSSGFGSQVTGNVDSVISSMGSSITFYQFGDKKDNDGDGCIDEEIMDGFDNDGDGLIDEDARVKLLDSLDNDKDGIKDNPTEEIVGITGSSLIPDLHLKFTLSSAGFVMGPKYKDKDFKAKIQADSAKTLSVRKMAKDSIGGCWNNYVN